MKVYLSIVVIFLALALVQCDETEDKAVQELIKRQEECMKESGAEGVEGTPSFDDPKIKCFFACLLKKDGIMTDGKVVVEKAVEFITKNQPSLVTNTTKADVTECADKANKGKDECEVGGAYEKCMSDKRFGQ